MALGFLYGAGGGGSSIPVGATVTPVGDVYTWQRCAGIANPQYTTLAELLADATTLAHVIDNANATDYLVRSKTWINNEGKVPKMTSATTPSGIAFSSTPYSSNTPGWKAFDEDNSTGTMIGADTAWTNCWVGYIFTNAVRIESISIRNRAAGDMYSIGNFKLQGSNDTTTGSDGTWTDLGSFTNTNNTANAVLSFVADNENYYKAYRLYITSNVTSTAYKYVFISEIQFYGASIPLSDTAMSLIGANNYASDTLLADSDWREAIVESPYFESVLNASVPKMTSNTTPSGECFASSYYGSDIAFHAFDDDNSTFWAASTSTNEYVGYKFTSGVEIKSAIVRADSSGSVRIKNFKIQASNDNTSWTDLYTGVYPNTANYDMPVDLSSNNTSYIYYRLYVIDNYNSSAFIRADEVQFYGRQDV